MLVAILLLGRCSTQVGRVLLRQEGGCHLSDVPPRQVQGSQMTAVKRALLMSTGERYVTITLNFAGVAAASRILTPKEIGISVIALAILGIALSAREFASSSFLIQRPVLSREEIRVSFSVMLLLTAAIALLLAAAAPALASFYEEANLVPYLRLVSVCLFFDLVPIQVAALLRREMVFGKVALINISGVAAGGAATIALALNGYSYMSFAWGWLAASIVSALISIALRPHFWMFRPSFEQWRAVASFGGYNGAMVFLFKVYEALPVLMLGRTSPHAAALFSRSLTVCQIPDKLVLQGAMSVVLPAFAETARQGGNLKKQYLHGLEMITALQWPALMAFAALAYPAVDVLLGQQWREVSPLVQIIAVASLFSFSFELNYPVMVALGSIKHLFVRTLIIVPVSAGAMTAGILLGGHTGAALSMLFILPFQAFVSMSFVRHKISVRWGEAAAALRKSAVVSSASVAGPLATVAANGFSFELSLGQAFFAGLLAAAGWIAGIVATRHPLFGEITSMLRILRPYPSPA
jgi:O-antigen/teichoic acid export membrane protein